MSPALTYLQFHLVFTAPALVALLYFTPRYAHKRRTRAALGVVFLLTIAFAYSPPWLHYMITTGVWSYGDGVVHSRVYSIPVGEILYIALQTLIVASFLHARGFDPTFRSGDLSRRPRALGVAFAVFCFLLGVCLFTSDPSFRYLGGLVAWVAPVLALQWAVGGGYLARTVRSWGPAVLVPSFYLCVTDRIAIGLGVWQISPTYTTGVLVFGLPVEEMLFFLLASLMTANGLVLFEWALDANDRRKRKGTPTPLDSIGHGLTPNLHIDRYFSLLPAVFMASVLPLVVFAPTLPVEIGVLAFAIATATVGMAHGAVDHLLPHRVDGVTYFQSVGVVSALYALLAAAVVAMFVVAPTVAVGGFIALTWFHWGQGDVAALVISGVEHLQSTGERLLALFVRGGLPMGVPFVSHPGEYRLVVTRIVDLFSVAHPPAQFFTPTLRPALGAILAIATFLSFSLGYRRVLMGTSGVGWFRDVGEVVLLWVWFVAVPPVLAIGVYFAAWHSLRHIGRLVLLSPQNRPPTGRGRIVPPVRRFARDAAPLTVGGVVFTVAFVYAVGSHAVPVGDVLAPTLVAIAALTLPHTVVVAYLDVRQRLWW